ncbi:mucoidy inhibitor A [Purpureocillium lilacinum]|uniref:Mucoidy inhibitor A n=1 Tax=Purpureocillium lilacinum TaxID=33203 RepID=A0A179H0V9_PURLI|nr:mucoidy inhibitor A [Purpureocillium lilacinum]OAQ83009.1 mucoidy inhibitor A [Purpureocillium lilacinum]
MDAVNKLEFHVRKLPTRSVTLFPTRAQVSRELASVQLKPGTNEITVLGLTPTADRDSVRVETASSVAISDVLVESLPNRDIWQDIYPSDSESESDDHDDDWEAPFRWDEGAELQAGRRRLEHLRDALDLANEKIANAEARLKYLDAYGKTLERKRSVPVADGLDAYKQERAKLHDDIMEGRRERRDADRAVTEHARDLDSLVCKDGVAERKARKAWERDRKPKTQAKEKRARQRMERAKERARIRREREDFWPKFCYAVRITIEAGAAFTPGSSRRASVVTTDVDVTKLDGTEAGDVSSPLSCDLVLSYVTSSAYWTPSYDLKLSTTNNTGALSFEAELHNATSETWSNCRVSLSTSQATFSGLDDAVPELTPWRLGLMSQNPHFGRTDIAQQILRSNKELESTAQWKEQRQRQTDAQRPRVELFGREQDRFSARQEAYAAARLQLQEEQDGDDGNQFQQRSSVKQMFKKKAWAPPPPPPMPAAAPARALPAAKSRAAPGASLDSMAMQSGALQRNISQVLERGEKMDSLGGGGGPRGGLFGSSGGGGDESDDDDDDDESNESSHTGSVVEETGMTTTFDLPGLKTLAPKHTSTKSPVARTTFTGVAYSHTVVAKYKPVAFLQARLRNTSRMTLFRGRAGLTLDGSFLGKATLPRCSPGADMTLSLGVDPAVKVAYPKPGVRRGTAGLFSKENTWVYTRSVLLHNTRGAAAGGHSHSSASPPPSSSSSSSAVSITVRDQVPVSQDDKLRVEVLTPQGLSLGGGVVAAGSAGLEARDGPGSGAGGRDWGRAAASLKRDGEVKWEVSLKPGRAVRLALEFAVAFPTGTYPFNDDREQ